METIIDRPARITGIENESVNPSEKINSLQPLTKGEKEEKDPDQLLYAAFEERVRCIEEKFKQLFPFYFEWIENMAAARLFQISRRKLAYYRETGRLAYGKLGNKIYYKYTDLETLMETIRPGEKHTA